MANSKMNNKPIIGITANLNERSITVSRDNSDSILRAGGVPIILPYTVDETMIDLLTDQIDGLLLTGGGDIDPTLFGEEPHPGLGSLNPERDTLEVGLIKRMLEKNKPILGICRGCQILNVAVGGDMYQDLASQYDNPIGHYQKAPRNHGFHTINISAGSLLNRISGVSSVKVNSYHHQAVRDLAPHFAVSATTTDGVIESFESTTHKFVLGLQWHPEIYGKGENVSDKIFAAFIESCVK